MSLPSPNLDDRTFEDLLGEAKARVAQTCPAWTDLTPHDPGVVLLEVFAYLTEVMLYRLNRLPDKVHVELLKLMGVRLYPPSAAVVTLTFAADAPLARAVEVPRGTRVAAERSEGGPGGAPVVFTTATEARIEAGQQSAQVLAYHAEVVGAELLGSGTGRPGLSFRLKRAPVIAPTGDELDLVVGVEATEAELDERVPARRLGDKVFRLWREVESFSRPGPDAFVYVADRATGTVTFAPALQREENGALAPAAVAMAEVPPAGREIRAWYRRGGGPAGNVPAHSLRAVRDPLPVKLTSDHDRPAVGGRAGETLANALLRGSEAIHSLQRAVAARDFEVLALRTSAAVSRARAFTRASLWRHAAPGTVEVLLVPDLPPEVRGPDDEGVTAEALRDHQSEEARRRIQDELDARKTMGTEVAASWTRLKCVSTAARVVAHRAEDPEAIRKRVVARLHRTLSPLPHAGGGGWRFGQALRASNVYDVLLSEPGVAHVEEVRLLVDEVPDVTRALASDQFQPRTWYAASGGTLFRSVNDADGWEPAGVFPGEAVDRVSAHPARAGLLAVSARLGDGDQRSRLHVSFDCGETWDPQPQTVDAVEDLAWTMRDGQPLLLLATRVGLFSLSLERGARPVQLAIDPADPDLGAWAVASAVDLTGAWRVAVSAMQGRGVFVTSSGGGAWSFTAAGLTNEDVRVLRMQRDGPRTFLWAGLAAASGAETGRGCRSLELTTGDGGAWQSWGKAWDGGSCLSLSFAGSTVYAGTHRVGVLWLDSSREGAAWLRPDVGSGLPLREEGRLFQPVQALAAAPDGKLLLAGGPSGVVRSPDARRWEACSRRELMEPQKVTLPPTWLFCSGKHDIEVVHDDAVL
ncbi:MAG TPA: hypothetical protein VFA20_22395 [Myxococcaceae bacterium]|nr:hypothetical protein [Myxococcaceae bacterium]